MTNCSADMRACALLTFFLIGTGACSTSESESDSARADIGVRTAALAAECDYVVHPTAGSDLNSGTELSPWKTIAHAFSHMAGSSTLCLRGGVHSTPQLLDTPPAGASGAETVIRSYPGERATIDTSFPEFQGTGAGEWEPDPSGAADVYRSVRVYNSKAPGFSGLQFIGGFMVVGGDHQALVGYRSLDALRSTEHRYSATAPYYAGPGTFWHPPDATHDGKIYIRLTPPNASVIGRPFLVTTSTNPNDIPLYLSHACDASACRAIQIKRNYLRFQSFDLFHGGVAFISYAGASQHVVFDDLRIHAAQDGIRISVIDHARVTNSLLDCHMPDWVAWQDFKRTPALFGLLEGGAISMTGVNDVLVERNHIRRCFDGVRPLGANPGDVKVLHNVFTNITDDGLHISEDVDHTEVAYNRFIGAGARGIGPHGNGTSAAVGTNYFHHNIIHATAPRLVVRATVDGAPPRYEGPTALATHGAASGESPWKIYNNTVALQYVEGQPSSGSSLFQYLGSHAAPLTQRHEVYNNVITTFGDIDLLRQATVATGREIFDGNVYWRYTTGAPTRPLWAAMYDYAPQTMTRSFATLNAFRTDADYWCPTRAYYAPGWEAAGVEANPRVSYDHVPAFDGPAGAGAVDLTDKGWPGLDGRRYRGAVPAATSRVIGAWPFNGASLADAAGFAHATTALGAPASITGYSGDALSFDGVDDGLRIARSGPLVDLEASSFTFSTWYRGTTTGDVFFSNAGSGPSSVRIATNNYSADLLDAQIGSARYYAPGFFPADGAWHHFMVSVAVRHPWDYRVEFYLDGVLGASEGQWISGKKHLVPSTSPELFVATAYPGGGALDSDLDEVRIFRGALQSDLPIAYFDFSTASPPTGNDLSGEGSLGSFYGGAAATAAGFDGEGLDLPVAGAGFKVEKRGRLAQLGSGPFTISFWFRGGNAGGFLFRNGWSGSTLLRAFRPTYSDQTLQVTIGDAHYHRGDFFAPTDSAWHLFTLTVDYTSATNYTVNVYLDGVLRLDESHRIAGSSLLTPGETEIHFGAQYLGQSTHLGQIDEIRVFDHVRVPSLPVGSAPVASCPP